MTRVRRGSGFPQETGKRMRNTIGPLTSTHISWFSSTFEGIFLSIEAHRWLLKWTDADLERLLPLLGVGAWRDGAKDGEHDTIHV